VRRFILTIGVCLLAGASARPAGMLEQQQAAGTPDAAVDLRPTAHPALPASPDQYWYVPAPGSKPGPAAARAAAADLAKAAELIAAGKAARARSLIRPQALAGTPLHGYATYLRGLAELSEKRYEAARQAFAAVRTTQPSGALAERAAVREAEAAELAGDAAAALALLASLGTPAVVPEDQVLLKTAQLASALGQPSRALEAWKRLYYDFPATEAGTTAARALAAAGAEPIAAGSPRVAAELARAERLFSARRFALAREGFELLQPVVAGDQVELVALRLAECDYGLRRFRAAAERARPFIDTASRRAEALFYYASAVEELGDAATFVALVRRIVDEHPSSSWAEDGLNALASHYIIANDDDAADGVFRELLQRYPRGRHAARAAWKAGWWAYKHDRLAEAAGIFERGAAGFPRSDYRPSWLYWAGRARERTGPGGAAVERYRLVLADYANSYYGRLTAARLKALGVSPDAGLTLARWTAPAAPAPPALPTADRLAWLMHAGLYEQALDEVAYAQKTWGRSPALDATRAYLLNRKGDLRPGITVMRQTYPHFLAAGGDALPLAVQQVIFPLDYWPLIKKYAATHKLDPFLVAALMAQESTFDPEIRSSANAIGLMQIVPQTGRRWARRLGIRGFSTRSLTKPEINVRIGTAYFAELVKKFGGVHVALAGYNAGDHRVARWIAERPGVPREEFIDDIPFPETQNYVKRILGTVEDYRRLYGR
jgi:soluble lytic murein transglycosylase